MQVLKLKSSGATDVMKSEGNNSVDTFIRQAIGKEPFLSFSRTGDSPIQWIQLLHALDQQDLPGWPLLSPVKVQMQKCEKCSREFCSTINYRRHNRLHRRTLNLDKDSSTKNRDCLKVYWDKLSTDETMTVVSFQDVTLEGVAGSSIIKALSSFIRKPGFSSLPPAYVKAGAVLLDVVQGRPSRFPLTSQELFSILDDASENTFLCAGMAESLQKYVFDGEVGKVGLEMRNLVACTSFLIEQKLVKAWLADKDAEALRCQKLLVEEEEAAQRRQAEILERKRQKKLRQKEQKAKAQACEDTADFPAEESADTSDSGAPSPPSLNPLEPSDSSLEGFDLLDSPREQYQMVNVEQTANDELHPEMDRGFSENGCDNVLSKTFGKGRRTYSANVRWHSTRFQKEQNGFHPTENSQAAKHGGVQKQGYSRDSRNLAVTNTNKVWTPKPRCGMDAESCATKLNGEQITAVTNQKKAREVLIGTISVAIGNCASNQNQVLEDRHCGSSTEEPPTPKCSSVQEKLVKSDIMSQGNTHRQVVKLWRPVSRHKNRAGQNSVLNAENNSADMNVIACSGINEAPTTSVDCSNGTSEGDSHPSTEGRHFSSSEAEAFLAQRWKEAVAADHVKLVLLPETPRPPGCTGDTILVTNQENSGIAKPPKNKRHTEKGSEVRYIPKQRNTG